MTRKTLVFSTLILFAGSAPLNAQDAERPVIPPQDALKASEIIARVEARNDFRYLDEVDWDEEGYYEIVYFTNDKAKVEMKIDPVTGEPI